MENLKRNLDTALSALAAAEEKRDRAEAALRSAAEAPDASRVPLVTLREQRAAARGVVATAQRKVSDARRQLAEAEARQERVRLEAEAAAEAARAREARAAHLAPYVHAVDVALDQVEARDRATMATAVETFVPEVLIRDVRPALDVRASIVASARLARPLMDAIVIGELAAEDAALVLEELMRVGPEHESIAPARARLASMAEGVVLEQLAALALLVGRSDAPDAPVARAQSAVAELAYSRKVGRWWGGDREARQAILRPLITAGVAFVAAQIPAVGDPSDPIHVRTAPGLPQCHRLPDSRPRLADSWGPPPPARERVIAFFQLAPEEHDLAAEIRGPRLPEVAA